MKRQQYVAVKHCNVFMDQMVVTLEIALFSRMNPQHGPFTSLCPHNVIQTNTLIFDLQR
jgi:hypothetical protein